MKLAFLNCWFLLVFVPLGLVGCETTRSGSYQITNFEAGFEYAQQAIDRKDWDAAYRHLEHNLYLFDDVVKSRAVAMISAHPEIGEAAHTSFSKTALYEYARNNPAEYPWVQIRLQVYEDVVATPDQAAWARDNVNEVYAEEIALLAKKMEGEKAFDPVSAAVTDKPDVSEDTFGQIERYDGLDQLTEGCIAVEVRAAQEGEVQKLTFVSEGEEMGAFLGINHLFGAAGGLTAAPLLLVYVGYVAVGIPATGGTISSLEARRRGALEASLVAEDFAETADAALRRRLPSTCLGAESSGARRVQVLILGYGFEDGGHTKSACAFVSAVARLYVPGFPMQETGVLIGRARQSPDAPPPYCTNLERLLADDGAVARKAVTEAAHILGAIVARRLEVPP